LAAGEGISEQENKPPNAEFIAKKQQQQAFAKVRVFGFGQPCCSQAFAFAFSCRFEVTSNSSTG
jgi:hypothetical protein